MSLSEQMKIIEVPNWLKGETFTFNLEELLKNSLYYPACGYDGSMVKNFRSLSSSFIYVDADATQEKLNFELNVYPFDGFDLIYQESIPLKGVISQISNFPLAADKLTRSISDVPFCEWMIFENEQNERFSLLYIVAEATAVYHELYVRRNIAPIAIGFRRVDGFSGNVRPFLNEKHEKTIFEKIVMNNTEEPTYLITDRHHTWEKYQTMIEEKDGLMIFKNIEKRNENVQL